MKRILGSLAVLAVVAAPSLGAALDAPHDQAYGDMTFACRNCHGLTTVSPGGKTEFTTGCITCHNDPARPFPWTAGDQAIPGVSGKHHSWSGVATQPAHGAASPTAAVFAQQLVDGNLQCTVCHDPHRGAMDNAPGSRKVSMPVGSAQLPTSGAGTARMTLVSPGTSPKGTRVKISTAGGFIVSHDYGLASPTWFVWSGGAWAPGQDNGPGQAITAGQTYTLDDAAISISFTAVPPAGDSWDFVVAYPFVRSQSANDEICMVCHASRTMSSAMVRGELMPINGARLFSHPIGEALNQNGKSYDQAVILDANGATQTVGDGVPGNDLVLKGANTVGCTTCHAVHGATSNSLP